MSTLGDLKSRIYSEIHQTMSTAVQNAILDSVKYYQTERFWFNEASVNFSLSLTTQYALSVIPKLISVDTFKIWEGGIPSLLNRMSWTQIEQIDSETSSSNTPSDYAIHHEILRIYARPSVTITAQVNYHKAITLSASNSASSVWTNEAEEIIRHRAKGLLYANILLDPTQAQVSHTIELQSLNRLFARTAKRQSSGKIKGYL